MNKVQAEIKNEIKQDFEGMAAKEIWEKSYNQMLDSKKHILEYIDCIKLLSKEKINNEQTQAVYIFIEEHIDAMKASIKPNTILQLKKELNAKLGQFAPKRNKQPDNHFLKFFIEAYPKNKRYKEYTWVLMDLSRINDDQILHTLKYINAWCLKNKLNSAEKKDIIVLVRKLISKGNLKYINQVKSLEGLTKGLKIKIIDVNGKFEVTVYNKSMRAK
ncbi:hypothetical protein [Cellulosilyticum sp. I15G10I2]|uniref:hypothetical protein n=1 Tax=Cellulosilyticum sp. I15G10I2 TaxID=1892843 RepID=UPI00085C4DC3|nr:hypothetical protein [Cellulosilyticum sp. I15G10I2]